jgi:glycosyltransferase involved in cell wall biosynthesis
MKLTIAIPTYNRNEILLQNLALLLPQLTEQCELLIIDNCSIVPVEATVDKVLQQFPNLRKRLLRNRINIGASANVLRCFELCETEWLWVLGDDDAVTDNAVATILRYVGEFQDCCFLNFLTPIHRRQKRILTRGIDDFIDHIDHFGNILSVSASVFRVKDLLQQLRFGYHYAYSFAAHFAILLASLDQEGICLLADEQLLSQLAVGGQKDRWSYVDAGLGIFTLLQLPLKPRTRRRLAHVLIDLVSLEAITLQLFQLRLNGQTYSETVFLYDHVCYYRFQLRYDIQQRLRSVLYRLLLRFPSFGKKAFIQYLTIRGVKRSDIVAPVRYA